MKGPTLAALGAVATTLAMLALLAWLLEISPPPPPAHGVGPVPNMNIEYMPHTPQVIVQAVNSDHWNDWCEKEPIPPECEPRTAVGHDYGHTQLDPPDTEPAEEPEIDVDMWCGVTVREDGTRLCY